MIYESKFLLSLFLTLVIEIPVLFLFFRYLFNKKSRIPNKDIFVSGIIASALTLPYLWFIMPPYINARYYPLIGELIVVVIEALIFNQLLKLNLKSSLIISFIANAVSFGLGWLIFY